MDFELALKKVLEEFDRQGVRYALMGGFALGALGAPRATADLDFLVHKEDLDKVHQIASALGYERTFHTENVSQYGHRDLQWGALDFIHAFRKISLGMLERAAEKPVFGGARAIRVLMPEDIIGLKVQAMANDPQRKNRELADMEMLMGVYKSRLDWGRLQEYFQLFNFLNEFKQLRQRFDHAE